MVTMWGLGVVWCVFDVASLKDLVCDIINVFGWIKCVLKWFRVPMHLFSLL